MFQQMKKRIKNEKGLTLIELLAVIVILAVIAAIAMPAIGNVINNQKDKAVLAEASNAIATAKIAFVEGTCEVGATATDAAECTEEEMGFEPQKISDVTVTKTGDAYTVTFTGAFKGDRFILDSTTAVPETELYNVMQTGATN